MVASQFFIRNCEILNDYIESLFYAFEDCSFNKQQ